MNTDSQAGRAGRDPADDKPAKTPSTDMQPEDAGTADSGAAEAAPDRGNPAESAMKQTSKTEQESGGRP